MALEFDTRYHTADGVPVKIRLTEIGGDADAPIRTNQATNGAGSTTMLGLGQALPETSSEPQGSHAFKDIENQAIYQLEKINSPEFPHLAGAPTFKLSERYKRVQLEIVGEPKTFAGDELIPAGLLYLFNVIVALQWKPSKRTIDTAMRAFSAASDVLYDATNGAMAFGQVVFAGPEYLDRADVQILASNRFHPRSMVNGLTEASKYSPIRLGRGIWRKDRQILLAWDDNTGYRAIAHEWAHYALGLHDEYIDDTLRVAPQGNRLAEDPAWGVPIVVPRILVSLQTLMETLDADELVPLQNDLARADGMSQKIKDLRDRVMNRIDDHYSGLESKLLANNPGPGRFPIDLPHFFQMPDLISDQSEESLCNIEGLKLDHCWLYSYAYQPGAGGHPALLRIAAQGRIKSDTNASGGLSLSDPWFKLLGVKDGDQLLAVGLSLPAQQPGMPRPIGTPTTQVGDISGANWTQPPEQAWAPVVAVIPATSGLDWPKMQVRVRVTASNRPNNVWLSLPGDDATPPIDDLDAIQTLKHMDGIVTLEQAGEAGSRLWVAEFSYGGNPPTTVKSPGAPISAGSSDGNLMIFSQLDDVPQPSAERKDDYKTCIVTTRNYAGFEDKNPGRPAGYLFSVASREQLDIAKLSPTIVMYYDSEASEDGHDLVVHRYDMDNQKWQALATYLPSAGSYAATPINSITAPSLVAQAEPPNGRVEYYRLFSIPR